MINLEESGTDIVTKYWILMQPTGTVGFESKLNKW